MDDSPAGGCATSEVGGVGAGEDVGSVGVAGNVMIGGLGVVGTSVEVAVAAINCCASAACALRTVPAGACISGAWIFKAAAAATVGVTIAA